MASTIPETAMRLQASVFVDDTELLAIGRDEIMRKAARKMAEDAVYKILRDCTETVGNYMGHNGQTLKIDCFVLAPHELYAAIANARDEGQRDLRSFMGSIVIG